MKSHEKEQIELPTKKKKELPKINIHGTKINFNKGPENKTFMIWKRDLNGINKKESV